MAIVAADPDTYMHLPLQDPSKQIRLLSFDLSDEEANDDDIRCTLSTWSMDDKPEYHAISYTWGSPENTRQITINSRPFTVRENCYYALWQVRLHWPHTRVWIDSICINQSDDGEKSVQVAMMGNIYASADRVCACVGPDSETTPFLLDCLARFDEFKEAQSEMQNRMLMASLDPTSAAIIQKLDQSHHNHSCMVWLWSLGRDTLFRLSDILHEFGNRDYWSRLWILQELRGSGGDRLHVLCGPHFVHFNFAWELSETFQNMYWLLNQILDEEQGGAELDLDYAHTCLSAWKDYPDMTFVDNALKPLDGLVEGLSLECFSCFDLRDRVYGTLTLVDWSMGGPAIVPDYSLSIFDLALDLAQRPDHTSLDSIEYVTNALGIHSADLDFGTWLHAKRSAIPKTTTLPTVRWRENIFSADPLLVFLNEYGETYSDMLDERRFKKMEENQCDTSQHEFRIRMGPHSWLLADAVVLPGDIVVFTDFVALALRPRRAAKSSELEVVARIRPAVYISPTSESPNFTDDYWSHCRCYGAGPFCRIYSVGIHTSTLDAMELASYGTMLEDPGRSVETINGHLTEIPRNGSLVRDLSAIKLNEGNNLDEWQDRPLLIHLTECPYMQDARRNAMAKGMTLARTQSKAGTLRPSGQRQRKLYIK